MSPATLAADTPSAPPAAANNGAPRRAIQLPVLPARAVGDAEALRAEVARGMLYAHHRANANTGRALETAAFAYAAIELLIERGLLSEAELDERQRQVAERLEARFRDSGMGVLRQEPEHDKYAFGAGPMIDCERRLPVCRAACCRLPFALSRQDVEEGVVQWEFGRPYLIRHAADGWCAHLERGSCRCGVHAQRPFPCRAYDCSKDERIWADFEGMILDPGLQAQYDELDASAASAAAGA